MAGRERRRTLACLGVVAGALAVAGCGGAGGGTAATAVGGPAGDWPQFGRLAGRTQYLAARPGTLDPPLRQEWSLDTHDVNEDAPVLGDGAAFLVNRFGQVRAVGLGDHRLRWAMHENFGVRHRQSDAKTPAYADGRLFVAFQVGNLVAFDAATGRHDWERRYAHLEFSPLVARGSLYVGADHTKLIALRASDGRTMWKFDAPEQLGASPSYGGGRVYATGFKGKVFCLRATDGKLLWRVDTAKVPPGGEGTFISPPAAAFGRVFVARSDGRLFALDQRSGRIDWSVQIHASLESSPAVARVPGTPPTVYIGSQDGHLYALNVQSGKVEWRFKGGGGLALGTPVVIGRTVYVLDYETVETLGIDLHSHRETFHMFKISRPASDGRDLYASGFTTLVALQPTR